MKPLIVAIGKDFLAKESLSSAVKYLHHGPDRRLDCPAKVISLTRKDFQKAWFDGEAEDPQILRDFSQAERILLIAADEATTSYLDGLSFAQRCGKVLSNPNRHGGEPTIFCAWQTIALTCRKLQLQKLWMPPRWLDDAANSCSLIRYKLEACGLTMSDRPDYYPGFLSTILEIGKQADLQGAWKVDKWLWQNALGILSLEAEKYGLQGIISVPMMRAFFHSWCDSGRCPSERIVGVSLPVFVGAEQTCAEAAWEWIADPTKTANATKDIFENSISALASYNSHVVTS